MISSLSYLFASRVKEFLTAINVPISSIEITLTPNYDASETVDLRAFVIPTSTSIETSTRDDVKQSIGCDIVLQKYIGNSNLQDCDEYIKMLEQLANCFMKLHKLALEDGIVFTIDSVDTIALADAEQLERSYIYCGQISVNASAIGVLS